jgi:hypothetical protein
MEIKELPDVEELLIKAGSIGVDNAISYVEGFSLEYPVRTGKPILDDRTPTGLRQHADELEAYEEKMIHYNQKRENYSRREREIKYLIKNFLIKQVGAEKLLTPRQLEKVWEKAWEDGHSSGYYQVYCCLIDLIALFEE